jgi:hypothetical protein
VGALAVERAAGVDLDGGGLLLLLLLLLLVEVGLGDAALCMVEICE